LVQLLGTAFGPTFGISFWAPLLGATFGRNFWAPLLGATFGRRFWSNFWVQLLVQLLAGCFGLGGQDGGNMECWVRLEVASWSHLWCDEGVGSGKLGGVQCDWIHGGILRSGTQ